MTELKDDLLEGAPAIAEFLGWNIKKVYNTVGRSGSLIKKDPLTGHVCASKSALRRHYAELLGAA